jgi:REP-associated tyrosine transposase
MSHPRRVLPGKTVMITRRVLCRTYLLRPDPELNKLFLYCLSVMAERFGITVHAANVMSDHYHLVVTDHRGERPHFLRDLNRTLARGIQALRNWKGPVWVPEKPSVVELRTEQAVVEETGYLMGNPVAAHAVRRAHQWPGIQVLPDQLGRLSWTVKRPDFYFDADNPLWPEVATLRLGLPPVNMSDELLRDNVAQELERIETQAHDAAKTQCARFMGREQVLAISPFERATSVEAEHDRNPTFAVGRGQREAFFEAVRVVREFRKSYSEALKAWRDGVRDVLFPAGTWFMRWAHGAMVAPS